MLAGPVAECLGQFDYQFRLRITDSDSLTSDIAISGNFGGPVDISVTAADPIYLDHKSSPIANAGSLSTNMGFAGTGTLTYNLNIGG